MDLDGNTLVKRTSFPSLHSLPNLEPNPIVLWSKELATPLNTSVSVSARKRRPSRTRMTT